jgi:hypothetical protein
MIDRLGTLAASAIQFAVAYVIALPIYLLVKIADSLRRQYARRKRAAVARGELHLKPKAQEGSAERSVTTKS